MPLVLSHPRQPPGGHTFADPSGQTVKADSVAGLLSAIATYRQNNALPAGNPAAEVEAIYRVKYPWLVSKIGQTETLPPSPVATWLNHAWRTPQAKFVETIPAERRIATCLACPHYQPDHAFTTDQKRRLAILGRGKFAHSGACAEHHWAVGLAIWLESPDPRKAVPGCWATSA